MAADFSNGTKFDPFAVNARAPAPLSPASIAAPSAPVNVPKRLLPTGIPAMLLRRLWKAADPTPSREFRERL